MAENASFSDDISELWGPQEYHPLAPPPRTSASAPTNGNHPTVVAEEAHEAVAALADALTSHHVDVVTKAELADVRTELEGAFTHQLAVALYELLGASNDRLASAEHHMDQRLTGIADRLATTVEQQADRLAALIEVQQRVSADPAEVLERLEQSKAGTVETLAEISERISSLHDDVSTLRQAVTEIRQAVDGQRRKS